MKRMHWAVSGLAVAALGLLVSPLAMAAPGTILGSGHDFSTKGYGSTEICVFCHTPHNANTSVTGAPLWNHALSAVASYTVYSSPSMNATTGQPGTISKLCLSCHDGTVAVDSFGALTGTHYVPATDNIGSIGAGGAGTGGTHLENDHPIGFIYNAALVTADPGLFPTSKAVTIGSTKSSTGTISTKMLYSEQVECASCHDVHNTYTVAGTGLLKVTTAGSALCLTCHDK